MTRECLGRAEGNPHRKSSTNRNRDAGRSSLSILGQRSLRRSIFILAGTENACVVRAAHSALSKALSTCCASGFRGDTTVPIAQHDLCAAGFL